MIASFHTAWIVGFPGEPIDVTALTQPVLRGLKLLAPVVDLAIRLYVANVYHALKRWWARRLMRA